MIFLQILKIIGIILLVLLAIILLLLLLILFDPIFYKLKGSVKDNNPELELKLHWLFYIIGVKGFYKDKDAELFYRIFFKKSYIYGGEENSDIPDNIVKEEVESDEDIDKWESLGDIADESADEVVDESDYKSNIENVDVVEDKDETSTKDDFEDATASSSHKKKFTDKIREIISQVKKKYRNIKSNYRKYKRIITDDQNHQAVSFLKTELFKLIKAILPRRFKLNGIYSTGAPDKTAYVFGILSLFPFTHNKDFRLATDFEADKFYFDGDFDIKGRIYLVTIVFIALRVFFDRKCRRLYKMLKK